MDIGGSRHASFLPAGRRQGERGTPWQADYQRRAFLLKGASPTANEGITASPAKVYAYREAGSDRLVVRSSSETMCRCELFNESGKLGGLARFESDEYHLSAVRGVNIIKIYFKDGRSETLKIAYF